MAASFLLARRFGRKKSVSRMIIILASASLLSVGLSCVTSDYGTGYVNPRLPVPPLPLSLPFYAGSYLTVTGGQQTGNVTQTSAFERHYGLFILGMTIKNYNLGSVFEVLRFEDFVLVYAFFALVNLAGALLGYRISESTFVKKHLARRPPK